jgi:hypothetical protein
MNTFLHFIINNEINHRFLDSVMNMLNIVLLLLKLSYLDLLVYRYNTVCRFSLYEVSSSSNETMWIKQEWL